MLKKGSLFLWMFAVILTFGQSFGQDRQLKIFISVDMEGIGGIGTNKMVRGDGKDYALGRKLMTEEVNTVVKAIFEHAPAEILVNDSHGDMQNLLHTELDERVTYIQGNIKPFGMVQGLDSSFDGVIFIGYHTRAGAENGFLAHTGSGAVKGLWLNDFEVGEGGMNAAYAGELGVPVILAAGDSAFTVEIRNLLGTGVRTVATKEAIGSRVAKLYHPEKVRARLSAETNNALASLATAKPFNLGKPVQVKMRFATTTRADVLQAIPGMRRVDGFTVAYTAEDMEQAYKLIRLMYKYISF
jgi:D-amino peptidase